MTKCLILIAVVLLLVGCAMDQYPVTRLEPQQMEGGDYRTTTMHWTGTYQGLTTDVRIKTFDSGGKLGICAARIGVPGSDLEDKWFWNAFVTVGGQKMARAQFVDAVDPRAPESEWWARCIQTTVPSEGRLYERARIVGGEITMGR